MAKEKIKQFCKNFNCFKIQFSSIAYFPSEESVLFLNPKSTIELISIQQKLTEFFNDFKANISPKTWIPHYTIAVLVIKKKLPKAIDIIKEEIMMSKEEPFYVDATGINVIEHTPFDSFKTNPPIIKSITEFELKGSKKT